MKINNNKNSEEDIVETIQNEKILASSIFNKNNDEYYVLIYDSSNDWADYYSMVYDEYKSVVNEKKLYWVDLSVGFNSDIIAEDDEESNPGAKKYEELKVKSPTLIHIKKGKNVDYYEGEDVVKELTKIINSFKNVD